MKEHNLYSIQDPTPRSIHGLPEGPRAKLLTCVMPLICVNKPLPVYTHTVGCDCLLPVGSRALGGLFGATLSAVWPVGGMQIPSRVDWGFDGQAPGQHACLMTSLLTDKPHHKQVCILQSLHAQLIHQQMPTLDQGGHPSRPLPWPRALRPPL